MALISLILAFLLGVNARSSIVEDGSPQVNLDYATYEGTALQNGLNQFLGMRYAASPVGQNRFKKPFPPKKEAGVVPATKHGPICYGVKDLDFRSAPIAASEDCLFIDVYAPANASNDKTPSQLPVMLWIQGGGFVELVNPNYNGTGLIEASHGEVIVVTFNYRVGPYGFLAGEDLTAEGNLNVGLHDQRAAIRWVRKHIAKFGGDPDKITLFGTSIGGASVLMHALSWGGNPPTPNDAAWSSGIAQSVYMPSVHNVKDMQFQYDQLLASVNCTTIACLRELPSERIQAVNIGRPYPWQAAIPLFPYEPVINSDFFTDEPRNMLKAGKFNKDIPLLIGTGVSEGTVFVPQVNTKADLSTFLWTQFPYLQVADIDHIESHYADVPATWPGVTAPVGSKFFELAKIYGDVAFNCPAIMLTSAFASVGQPAYFFQNNIIDRDELAAGWVVPHTWEVSAVWGPQYSKNYVVVDPTDSFKPGGDNAAIVKQTQRYWTRFARTAGNPGDNDLPAWEPYGNGQRLVLETNRTRMAPVPASEYKACGLWDFLSNKTHI